MKRLAILTLCLMLAACGGAPLVNPNVSQVQANRDTAECRYEVARAVPDNGTGSALAIGLQRRELFSNCMEMRGYR